MSLSDLFGDLGDDEDEEDDYRPDAAQISDIESADEIAPSVPAATNVGLTLDYQKCNYCVVAVSLARL